MGHKVLLDSGMELLCSHLVGGKASSHAKWIASEIGIKSSDVVADMGCGTGELSKHINAAKFYLVNKDANQISGEGVLNESFHSTSIESGSCDVVLFHYSLVHADLHAAISESMRVLKFGGKLAIYEPFGEVNNWGDLLAGSVLHSENSVVDVAKSFGFEINQSVTPDSDSSVCKKVLYALGEGAIFEETFAKISPKLLVFEKRKDVIADLISRHKNVALSLSGGKDSLACLYLYKPYWNDLTVYWCNTGDAFPETIEFMERIKKLVPNFKEIKGRQPEIHAMDGWPSDVVPAMHTTDGNAIFGKTDFKVQPRVACCFRSMMFPTYKAMLADGVTCVIRGKRHDEADKTGLMSGHVSEDGMELVFPIYEWTSDEVYSYLKSIDVELPSFYKHGNHSIDCQHCTAFWEDGHANYLRNEHPVLFFEYKRRMALIKGAIADQMKLCEV